MNRSAEEKALDGGHHGDNEEQTGLAPDLGADPHGNLRPCEAEVTLGCAPTELFLLWANYCVTYSVTEKQLHSAVVLPQAML